MKKCSKCGELKELSEFHKSKNRKYESHPYCKLCRKQEGKNRYQENKEKILKTSKKWKEENRDSEKIRKENISRRYKISIEQYDLIKEKQNNLCAICEKPFQKAIHTHLDHCHKTGKIRGFLCNRCNHGIGNFMDNIEIIKKAIKYLKKHKNPTN